MSAVCSRMSCATSGKVLAVRISAVSGFADVVAEVHGGQAQRIVGLADVEFAFVQLYLYFQHVVLGLEAVFMGAFHVLHQFRESRHCICRPLSSSLWL